MGNEITLWKDALPPESIPEYPTLSLRRAKGGETTYELDPNCEAARHSFKWQGWKYYAEVIEREAVEGELLREPNLRYIGDYEENIVYRAMTRIHADQDDAYQMLQFYFCRSSILYFINTFCYTYDPRSEEKHLPFVTYPFQSEIITWIIWLIKKKKTGIVEKSREQGLSWMLEAVSVWLILFVPASTAYQLSLSEESVDNYTPDSLLGKIRYILKNLPPWLRGGWSERAKEIDKKMMIKIPDSDSLVIGQLTKSTAGVGGRSMFAVYDEFAIVKEDRAALQASASLASSRLFLSTPRGMGNEFYRMADNSPLDLKRSPHWTQHPLKCHEGKDTDWAKLERLDSIYSDEIWASEQEINYSGSTQNRVYPEFTSMYQDEFTWCHIQDGDFFDYDPNFDVYVSMDFGQGDPTSMIFFQVKGPPLHFEGRVEKCLVIFDEEEDRFSVDDWALLLKKKGYRYKSYVGDYRTANQQDAKKKTWKIYLREHGIELDGKYNSEMAPIWEVEKLIRTPGALAINKHNCPHTIKSFQNWSYHTDRATGMVAYDAKPKHDQWSHKMKATAYGIDFFMTGSKTQSKKEIGWRFNVHRKATI